jgi:carbon starvation protein
MGVLVASFAGTTLDTACRLQRYVIQELAATLLPAGDEMPAKCYQCGSDLTGNISGTCPECALVIEDSRARWAKELRTNPSLTPNPISWLRNKHGATILAVVLGTAMAALPAPGTEWSWHSAGTGGLILWPMFGATNQLLGGLSFLVIAFYLWRRRRPIWFLVLPLVFMLIMPAWAMLLQLPEWLQADQPNWALIFVAFATLALEAWMIVEAVLLFPRAKGMLEAGASAMMDPTVNLLSPNSSTKGRG